MYTVYDDERDTSSGTGPSAPIQPPSQGFGRTVFFAIIDNLLVALSKRQAAYEKLNSAFGFCVGCKYSPAMKL